MPGAPNPRLRSRIELALRVTAPALDLALAVAAVVSRVLTREDPGPLPARMAHTGEAAPRALRQIP